MLFIKTFNYVTFVLFYVVSQCVVSRGVMRSAASSYAAMHMVAGSRPVFVIA